MHQVLIPIVEGDVVRARFGWNAVQRTLSADFPKGGALTMAFSAAAARVKKRGERELPYRTPELNPLREVKCAAGLIAGGATRSCASPCDASRPCAPGHCEPWPGGDFCAVP